uniref:P-loop NTPase fold protein n=1 Tax=Aliarcobacter sp. TaxID=2321116 RepID=UPI0040479B7C
MEKSNQKRLEEYLVGDKLKNELGYLQKDISNGKVIMLSGKWGSGKTYFWKNIIEKELIENQTKKQKAYVYSSLYGNRTFDKIEDNIYAQAYLCSVGGKNAVLSGYEKVKDFGKRFGSFCSLLDVSKLVDGIDDIQQKNIKKSALSYLENGGIVCFDDFERKSKDIDLNDLFGFISHLAIDLNCKVVIILNDDVFEGEEKNVFSRVKEKSVSKFLKYEPSIKDLFDSIFDVHEISKKFSDIKTYVIAYIQEINILNARIYNQVFDNLLEWLIKYPQSSNYERRYLVQSTVLFILFHTIFFRDEKGKYFIKGFNDKLESKSNNFNSIKVQAISLNNLSERKFKFYEDLNKYFNDFEESVITSPGTNFWKDDLIGFKEFYTSKYYANYLKIGDNVNDIELNKINNFIETGILINE